MEKPSAPSLGGWDDSGRSGGLVYERQRAGKLPLKRARLSPSRATGLIGLKENAYIADYFRKIGFVPFTTESFIRKAMVRTMLPVVQESDPRFHRYSAGLLAGEGEIGWGDDADVPAAARRDEIESAAGACVLWCTVAVGCLVGGRPQSSVDGYACLAREALSGCFDDESVATARAFTAMALLQDYRGNEEKFNRYVDFAEKIMRDLPATEVPMDLADAHMFVKARDASDGFYDQLGEEDLRDAMGAVSGLWKHTRPIQQAELCRWLLKTEVRLLACFSMDMQNTGFPGNQSKAEAQAMPRGARLASEPDGDDSGGLSSGIPPHGGDDDVPGTLAGLGAPAPRVCWRRPVQGTLAEPPPPGSMSETFAARLLPDMRLMMHATQRSEIRGGIGELCFQSIMGYASSLQRQREDAVDAALRCTDILVKNPGICRSTSWKHLVHICLGCMVALGNAEKYEQLRASYNSVADIGVPTAPPFAEFRGMGSICGNVFCMSVDKAFKANAAPEQMPSHHRDVASTTSDGQTRLRPPKVEARNLPAGERAWSVSIHSIGGSSRGNSVAHAPTADSAAVTAATSREEAQTGDHDLDCTGNGVAPSRLLLSEHSAQTGSANPDPADVGDTSSWDVGGRLERLRTSELDVGRSRELELLSDSEVRAAEAAGVFDMVDALVGEVVSEGLGQTNSEEDGASTDC
eukprot:g4603.t1